MTKEPGCKCPTEACPVHPTQNWLYRALMFGDESTVTEPKSSNQNLTGTSVPEAIPSNPKLIIQRLSAERDELRDVTVPRLTRERDEWKEWHANMQALRDKHSASVDRLIAERDGLRAALEKYGRHIDRGGMPDDRECCARLTLRGGVCDCGFEQALRGADETAAARPYMPGCDCPSCLPGYTP